MILIEAYGEDDMISDYKKAKIVKFELQMSGSGTFSVTFRYL